mgnify:CR=1 FL=1
MYAGGYSAVASHFVGLAPFVAMSTSVSLGALTTPLIISITTLNTNHGCTTQWIIMFFRNND